MAFDIQEALGEAVLVHPDAIPLFTDASQALFTLDIGPLNSDSGADAMQGYLAWRDENPGATLGTYLREISAGSRIRYDASILKNEVIEHQLRRDAEGEIVFEDEVHALDEAILVGALTQVIWDGRVDDDAKGIVAIALARQEHPLVLERLFGASSDLRRHALREVKAILDGLATKPEERTAPKQALARNLSRIAGTRIHAPSVPRSDGPPTDPEVMIKEIMDGAERPGGVVVSAAGKFHRALAEAYFWKLWEAELMLPGFVEIYLCPTARLPAGSFHVPEVHPSMFFRQVEVGVEPAQLRSICKGQATAVGIDLLGGAVAALAEHFDLDRAAVARAHAELRAHGLAFEVLLLAAPAAGCELRAYLAFRPDGKHQILVEHRSSEGVRRHAVPLDGEPLQIAGELKLVKGVVHLKPKKRSAGSVLKVPLSEMGAVKAP